MLHSGRLEIAFPFPDPFARLRQVASRELARQEAALVERVLAVPTRVANDAVRSSMEQATATPQLVIDSIKLISALPHWAADMLADAWRGPNARPLTGKETLAVTEIYGQRIDVAKVRVVLGPGISVIPKKAFANGNPAITIGNTIYIAPFSPVPKHDLTGSDAGLATLIHEWFHVIQYREFGYARFLAKYGSDMKSVNYDDTELYRYWKRNRTFQDETIEGQAEMAGRYGKAVLSDNAAQKSVLEELKRRLKGSGINGL